MSIPAPPIVDFVVEASDADVAFFAENGYLAVERVTTAEELDWLRGVYDEVTERPRSGFLDAVFDLVAPYGTLAAPTLGQLLFPERYAPQIRETAMWKNAKRIASKLLGVAPEKIENWGQAMFKPPLRGTVTPWHQDEAYWDPNLSYHAVGACMPLVLELIDQPDTGGAVAVPLKAGGMSFHHPRTMHYAGPNTTPRRRRAWANEYQTAPVRRDVPANRPWVQAGRDALKSRAAAAKR